MKGIRPSYTCLGLQVWQSPGHSAALGPGEIKLSAVTLSGRPIEHLSQQLRSSPAPRAAFLSPGTRSRDLAWDWAHYLTLVLLSSFLSSAPV